LGPDIKRLILIIGPTGVGKSAAAMALAGAIGGEIINCDSIQVYRGFDIGTDKPSPEDRLKVPHHLLDIVDGFTQFTAADFAARAMDAIEAILLRKNLPFVVGGTGLYFKALLDGLFPGPGRDEETRRTLEQEAEKMGLEPLWKRLEAVDPAYAKKIGKKDKIRIIRALEIYALTLTPISEHFLRTKSRLENFHILKIGLKLPREELYRRIETRVDRMFERGLVREVQELLAAGVDEKAPPFRALGYKYVLKLVRNEITPEEAVALTKIDTRHYAKRQMTWFAKMKDVNWYSPHDLPPIAYFLEKNLESQDNIMDNPPASPFNKGGRGRI
jgi:tRNA dimethylallyltransferase